MGPDIKPDMNSDIYRRLQRHLDRSPVPYPETASGVEIRLLKQLFDEEEAEITLKLSALPEELEKIHARFGTGAISRERLAAKLNGLAEKGAIQCTKISGREPRYQKLPLAIGMFEYQVDRVTREFAEDFFKYEEEGFADALLKSKTRQMRTIPVNVRIDPEFEVGNYDNVRKIIEKSPGPFAVMNCVCRQSRELLGEPCKQTDIMQTCFTIGNAAIFMKDRGVAVELDREEMLDRISLAEREGMVLQPANTQEPSFICCCCGCCCGVLTAAKKFPDPAELLHSNFYAEIDPSECTACGDCIGRCPMDALAEGDRHTEVLLSHCIGCGVCISACDYDAITLQKKQKETVPPRNSTEMYKKMIIDRYGVRGAIQFMGKAALGKNI